MICADLDRDGARDMAVLMGCCTVGAWDVLVIFRNTNASWRYSYFAKRSIFRIHREGRSIILKEPRYRSGDANCCPSSYRHYKVRWTHGRFRLSRATR